jgi:hypothetical protein
MKYGYINDKILLHAKKLYFYFHDSIYKFIKIFFNSFVYKELFIKNFIYFRHQHAATYYSKFFLEFENMYFEDYEQDDTTIFEYDFEFIKLPVADFFNLDNLEVPLEFLYVKNTFFKNTFYSFFFKKSVFFFSLDHVYKKF